jgi:EF-hand domain pair
MSVEILDASTICNFINDTHFFTKFIEERFSAIDSDHNGLLSFSELASELKKLRVIEMHFGIDDALLSSDELGELYHGMFARFDHDGNGVVDLEEFKSEMRELMLAIANGLGFLPVQMVLEEGSFLKLAVEREMTATKVYA